MCAPVRGRENQSEVVPILGFLASGARTKGTPTFLAQKACGNRPRKAVQEGLWKWGMGHGRTQLRVLPEPIMCGQWSSHRQGGKIRLVRAGATSYSI